jgi:hypothetical protein
VAEKLSELAKGISLIQEADDKRRRRTIQKQELRRIVTFFIVSNAVAGAGILGLAFLENRAPSAAPIVTDKVLMTLIGGITIQSGAIILAAFKGLFKGK